MLTNERARRRRPALLPACPHAPAHHGPALSFRPCAARSRTPRLEPIGRERSDRTPPTRAGRGDSFAGRSMTPGGRKPLGQSLVEQGHLTAEGLARALDEQRRTGTALRDVLLRLELVPE